MHGFVINVIHSLCTSEFAKQLSEKTRQQLRQLLAEFTLPKFYEVFGIRHCKCAPTSAFPHFRSGERSGLIMTGPVPSSVLFPFTHSSTIPICTAPTTVNHHMLPCAVQCVSVSNHSTVGSGSSSGDSSFTLPSGDGLTRSAVLRSADALIGITDAEFKRKTAPPTIVLCGEDTTAVDQYNDAVNSHSHLNSFTVDSSERTCRSVPFAPSVGCLFSSPVFSTVSAALRSTRQTIYGLQSSDNSSVASPVVCTRMSTNETSLNTTNPSGPCVHTALAPTTYGFFPASGTPLTSEGTDKPERLSLLSLEFLTDTLLEVMSLVIKEVPEFAHWLNQWTHLARKFAFQHNPALQPRAIIVLGCICREFTDTDIKQLLRIMSCALESYANELDMEKDLRHRTLDTGQAELYLIEAIIICLTRLLPLLPAASETHQSLFWVALGVLQLDEVSLYAAGLALLEQNLLTLDAHGTFEHQSLSTIMMHCREQFILQYKQMDQAVGLSFRDSFHFALVGHLLKGFRHPAPKTVARTIRVLNTLLGIVAKPLNRDKYQVTNDNVAYLAALLPVSEEVRKRCRLNFRVPGTLAGPNDHQPFCPQMLGPPISISCAVVVGASPSRYCASTNSGSSDWTGSTESLQDAYTTHSGRHGMQRSGGTTGLIRSLLPHAVTNIALTNRLNRMRHDNNPTMTAVASIGSERSPLHHTENHLLNHRSTLARVPNGVAETHTKTHRLMGQTGTTSGLRSRSIDYCPSNAALSCVDKVSVSVQSIECPNHAIYSNSRSFADPSAETTVTADETASQQDLKQRYHVLLDPEILNDEATQALTIAVLTTLVRYTTDENESRVLYEFLADASMVFPRVFPVIHSLLDSKINYVLTHCHDQKILSAVQSIIQNMISSGETSVQQLHYLQSIGFGGLWRFSGHFSKANQNAEAAQLFVNFLEVLIDSHLPGEDLRTSFTPVLRLGNTGRADNLSSSSSLSLSSMHGPALTETALNQVELDSPTVPLSPSLLLGSSCAITSVQEATEIANSNSTEGVIAKEDTFGISPTATSHVHAVVPNSVSLSLDEQDDCHL